MRRLPTKLPHRQLQQIAAEGEQPFAEMGKKTHFLFCSWQLGCLMVGVLDLTGEWIGHYPGHFDEVIKIEQEGETVEAIKITGDDYVPAGEVTWKADLRTMRGEGQVAEKEFVRPRLIPGRLTIVNPERIVFHWENCGEVEFRRDD